MRRACLNNHKLVISWPFLTQSTSNSSSHWVDKNPCQCDKNLRRIKKVRAKNRIFLFLEFSFHQIQTLHSIFGVILKYFSRAILWYFFQHFVLWNDQVMIENSTISQKNTKKCTLRLSYNRILEVIFCIELRYSF